MKQFDLSIVIPALNEERRIGKSLDELAEFLQKTIFFNDKRVEVLVVSADSTDETHAIVRSKAHLFRDLRLLKPGPRLGKGRDVKYGMLRAKGLAVIFMDADLATPLKHLPKFYKSFEEGADVVIATRNLFKHHKRMGRRLLSNIGNLVFRIGGGIWVEDSQCGFKLFSYEATQICFSRLNIMRWGFDMEILTIAKANKLKIVTHRVNDWKHMPDGTFEVGIIKNSLNSLVDIGYIFIKRITQQYKKDKLAQ